MRDPRHRTRRKALGKLTAAEGIHIGRLLGTNIVSQKNLDLGD
jgi:hypothetical protein